MEDWAEEYEAQRAHDWEQNQKRLSKERLDALTAERDALAARVRQLEEENEVFRQTDYSSLTADADAARAEAFAECERKLDGLALTIATRLRIEDCPHGLPSYVESKDPVPPWGEGATCRPLCDACVMQAIRDAIKAARLRELATWKQVKQELREAGGDGWDRE